MEKSNCPGCNSNKDVEVYQESNCFWYVQCISMTCLFKRKTSGHISEEGAVGEWNEVISKMMRPCQVKFFSEPSKLKSYPGE